MSSFKMLGTTLEDNSVSIVRHILMILSVSLSILSTIGGHHFKLDLTNEINICSISIIKRPFTDIELNISLLMVDCSINIISSAFILDIY